MLVPSRTPRYMLPNRGMGSLADIANAIQKQEGYFPGSVAYRNNNPGNLMYAGQPGASRGPNGFAVFPDYQTGYQALLNQVNLDASRGLTISQFANKYAPAAGGNDPATYAANLAAAVGLSPGDLLSAGTDSGGIAVPSDAAGSTDAASFSLADTFFPGADMTPIYIGLGLLGGVLAWRLFSR
jgi:hypothetical protein